MRRSDLSLKCFSPPVMLATIVIETGLAVMLVWRYKINLAAKLIVAIFTTLAVFQVAEYMVCGGLGLTGLDWARLGFVSITFLPPLGLHLAYVIANKSGLWVVGLAYGLAGLFVGYFLLANSIFAGEQCQGNYVIFQLNRTATTLYSLYYYGWLLTAVYVSWHFLRGNNNSNQRRALISLVIGYAAFLLPTTMVNLTDRQTLSGVPSIMCGFAVFLALILYFWVVPRLVTKK